MKHAQVCADPEQLQPLSPPECDAYLQPDNIRPFSLKHAKQQASIVGHMREAGLLQVRMLICRSKNIMSYEQTNSVDLRIVHCPSRTLKPHTLSLELAKGIFPAWWQTHLMHGVLFYLT